MGRSELKKRKIEFLEKLKELLSDYYASIDKFYGEDDFCIVTDGHLEESWESKTMLSEIHEDVIQEELDKLNL